MFEQDKEVNELQKKLETKTLEAVEARAALIEV